MGSNFHLVLHNTISVISVIATLGLAFFTFLNGPKKQTNILFACLFLSVTVFTISHVIGVNIADPIVSKNILMFNLSVFVIGAFQLHSVVVLVGKGKKLKWLVNFIYFSSALFIVLFLISPDLYLLPSQPKMYFPNYYVPGIFNWMHIVFLHGIICVYCMYELFMKYREKSLNEVAKTQYKYLMIALFIAYAMSLVPNFLIYNIYIDPLWGMSYAALFVIPFAYAAIQYEFLGIKVIAKQAFFYSAAVVVVGGVIIFLDYYNKILDYIYPGFPIWIVPLISSFFVVTIGVLVWRNLRKNEILKSEFITTVTHKFRTPLTYIKWATDNMTDKQTLSAEERKAQINYIRTANEKLVELTNLLVNVSDAEDKAYAYNLKKGNLSSILEDAISLLENQFTMKHIHIIKKIDPGLMAMFDDSRIKFVVQVILENAFHYSLKGGTVTISAHTNGRDIICSVRDTGLGMASAQIPLLFSKFYRNNEARHAYTEGMGIGLYISQRILEKHNGKIWAESEGSGKGSIFSFSLPRAK